MAKWQKSLHHYSSFTYVDYVLRFWWRPGKNWSVEKREREYFYECDKGAGGKKMKQPGIKTSLTTLEKKPEDTRNSNLHATPTVGPGVKKSEPRAGIK